jgi:Na+/proline symporter
MAISPGFGGISGKFTNIFDSKIMWAFGLPITISLFSGIVVDQQQWQRAFSIKSQFVKKSFLIGSLIFVLIPLALGSLGLIAANKSLGVIVSEPQLAGFSVIQNFLPQAGLIVFIMMVVAALVASGSAALSATGSMGSIDLYKIFKNGRLEKLDKEKRDNKIIKTARWTMVIIITIAMSIALVPNIQILYLQLLIGAFRAALIIPTILALFWNRLQERPTFWGILVGMVVGVPLFIYGSIYKIPSISSFGTLLPIIITAIFCYFGSFRKKLKPTKTP